MESMVSLAGKKVFVTGGNGFLGSWLVKRLLDEGASVTCLIKESIGGTVYEREGLGSRVAEVAGRLEDLDLMRETLGAGGFDAVFHLAAQAIVTEANGNPIDTFRSNIEGTWNLLEACRTASGIGAIVVASSDKAYGDSEDLPYREGQALVGIHPYDVSKSCTDLLSGAYAKSYGMNVGIVRAGNIIGGGDQNWNRIVPGTIRSLARGESPIVRSDGKYVRDYVHAEDVVEAYLLVADALRGGKFAGEAWNVSMNAPTDVLAVVRKLAVLMGKEGIEPVVQGIATNEIRDQYLDSTKIRTALGWKPRRDLDSALGEAISWYLAGGNL